MDASQYRRLRAIGPWVLAGIGAAIGAWGRWTIGQLIGWDGASIPWPTLIVNLVGAAIIGLAARRLVAGSALWNLLVTGVLGGFTTASTLAEETRYLISADRPLIGIVYLVITLGGGLLAVEVGSSLVRNNR